MSFMLQWVGVLLLFLRNEGMHEQSSYGVENMDRGWCGNISASVYTANQPSRLLTGFTLLDTGYFRIL
jgi:hypothetical protein